MGKGGSKNAFWAWAKIKAIREEEGIGEEANRGVCLWESRDEGMA